MARWIGLTRIYDWKTRRTEFWDTSSSIQRWNFNANHNSVANKFRPQARRNCSTQHAWLAIMFCHSVWAGLHVWRYRNILPGMWAVLAGSNWLRVKRPVPQSSPPLLRQRQNSFNFWTPKRFRSGCCNKFAILKLLRCTCLVKVIEGAGDAIEAEDHVIAVCLPLLFPCHPLTTKSVIRCRHFTSWLKESVVGHFRIHGTYGRLHQVSMEQC